MGEDSGGRIAAAAACFEQEPGAALRFVDPVLDQARSSNVVMPLADFMRRAQASSQLLVVAAKLNQHVLRRHEFRIVVRQPLMP